MQLPAPFLRIPFDFDATRLAAEVAQFTEAEWRPHPQGHPGNSALQFIARHGNPQDDGVSGPMRPTPHLARCPYVMQVMAALDVPLGRSRLMRLDARAEATPHVDTSYYWQQRVRVHVPVVTFPDVQFLCGDAATHMAPGECWIFDTWRMHNVLNPGSARRTHLVVDTVGSAAFWQRLEAGGTPVLVAPQLGAVPSLHFEAFNVPLVMSPWELQSLWSLWLASARSGDAPASAISAIDAAMQPVLHDWRATWAQFETQPEGWPQFAHLRERIAAIGHAHAGRMTLPNKMDLAGMLSQSLAPVLMSAERGARPGAAQAPTAIARPVGTPTPAWTPPATAPHTTTPLATAPPSSAPPVNAPIAGVLSMSAAPAAGKIAVQWGTSNLWLRTPAARARIIRPLVIVSAPRSGSTLLFETLAQAPGLFTVGGESHQQFESIPALQPRIHGKDSNRLEAADATPAIVDELQARFIEALRDRHGNRPGAGASSRLLEKTPKNALRVPFLDVVFPGAQYVYLYRDPQENVSSMIEGWESGRFTMYSKLPGWHGLPWSFLLIPGWRDLIDAPLPEVAAVQWQRTQSVLLDDLEALPRERVHALTYKEFVAAPGDCVREICAFAGIEWDRPLPPTLPLSRYTVSAPHPEKWRRHESQLSPYMAALERVAERARCFVDARREVSGPAIVAAT